MKLELPYQVIVIRQPQEHFGSQGETRTVEAAFTSAVYAQEFCLHLRSLGYDAFTDIVTP